MESIQCSLNRLHSVDSISSGSLFTTSMERNEPERLQSNRQNHNIPITEVYNPFITSGQSATLFTKRLMWLEKGKTSGSAMPAVLKGFYVVQNNNVCVSQSAFSHLPHGDNQE